MTRPQAILLLAFPFMGLFASAYPQASKDDWVRIQNPKDDFSIAMPADLYVTSDKEGFTKSNPKNSMETADFTNIRSLSGVLNSCSMYVEVYKVGHPKDGLDLLMFDHSGVQIKVYKLGKVAIRQVIYASTYYHVINYFATDSSVYVVGAAVRDPNNTTVGSFLSSIRINGNQPFHFDGEAIKESNTLTLDQVKDTPVDVVEDLVVKGEKNLGKNDKKALPAVKPKETDPDEKPYILLQKPKAVYTEEGRNKNEQGSVTVRITLLPDGRIEKIAVLTKLKYGLVENVVRVARRIKFIPAERNGVAHESQITMQYGFAIY